MNSRYPPAEPITIPKERVFIDAVSLDEEIQLERELLEEEMRPIEATWAAFVDRGSWPQPLPMQIFRAKPRWHLTGQQNEFLQHLVFQGEIGQMEAVGLVHGLCFRSALDLLREKNGQTPISLIVDAANLMSELRAVA